MNTNGILAAWRTMMMAVAIATVSVACAVDDAEIEDDSDDTAEATAEVRAGRPNNTGGIGRVSIPGNIGSIRGFSRIRPGYVSALDVWNTQHAPHALPRSGYAVIRGCAERLCAVQLVFNLGEERRPVDLLISKSEMSEYGLRAPTMPLDSGAYAPRTDNGTFRSSDSRVGERLLRAAVTARPTADILYKRGISSSRVNNYVVDAGLLGMMDANNGGSGAGYSAVPIFNGMFVRTTGRTFSMRVDGNDIVYAEVYFNLENLAGPRDRIRTWIVDQWSNGGRWSATTLR